LYTRSRLAIVEDSLEFCRGSAPWQRLVQSGFYEVALTTRAPGPFSHATSQNPQDFLEGATNPQPAVRIDLRLSGERVRVVAGGFDVALRMGDIEDSELVGRSLPDIPTLLVASRAHLDRQGIPHTVEELCKHQIVTRTDLDHWSLDGQ
jgi:DNA-binding transcriptional LysR family regulator